MKVTLTSNPNRYTLKHEDGTHLRICNSYNWLQLATIFGASFSPHLQKYSHEGWAIDNVIGWLDIKVGQVFDVPDDSFSGFSPLEREPQLRNLPRPLEQMKEEARRDDWHLVFVGSDIRQLIGEIERLREAAAAVVGEWDQCDWGLEPANPKIESLDVIVETLRRVADIKSPPADVTVPGKERKFEVDPPPPADDAVTISENE